MDLLSSLPLPVLGNMSPLYRIALLAVSTLLLAKILSTLFFKPSGKKLPPKVRTLPLIGGIRKFMKGPIKMIREEYPRLGSVFTVKVLNRNITFLLGPEESVHFFKAPESEMSQQEVYQYNVPTFGPGVVFDVDYSVRMEQFRFFSESLRVGSLKSYVEHMVYEAETFFAKWGDEGEVDLKSELEHLIILTASRCLLGREVRDQLFQNVSDLFHDLDNGMLPISVLFPYLPIPAHKRRDNARKELADIFAKIIQNRRASGKSETDMLQAFIDSKYRATGRSLTDYEITGLLIAALFAGQHTSSITSTWTGAYLLRLNTPHTDKIELDFLGYRLQLAQDPNSKHLGTTVWDSSMVFVKFLEQNCRKGELSHSKLAGKRVIELGAGCGLSGLGMALLGCHVVATDQVEVLPLLMRNLERNMARAKHSPSESPYLGSLGTVEVAELDWGNEEQIRALKPPFDYIIGSDIVYKEQLLQLLLSTLLGLAGPKTTILLANEYRSSSVHDRMLQLWKENFNMKIIPRSKMDSTYQHECIQLFSLKSKAVSSSSLKETSEAALKGPSLDVDERGSEDIGAASLGESFVHDNSPLDSSECVKDKALQSFYNDVNLLEIHDTNESLSVDETNVDANNGKDEKSFNSEHNDWEIRRLGSMAARLMQNVL